ncbi:MAG TPA: S8 family serine peptidase [Actinomycetota bacterium]|nr:S8 family serine peptidase [Actinomycetota bacterium]
MALTLALLTGMLSPAWAADTSLYEIPFSAGTVDPARDLPETDPAGRDLVLVQFDDFGDTAAVHDVAATGAGMVQPLAPVSYLVWADAAETEAIRALDGVRFAGVLPPDFRVAPSVTDSTQLLRVTVVGSLPAAAGFDSYPRAFTELDGTVVEVPGGAEAAAALARIPRVYSVADAGGVPQLRDEKSAVVTAQGSKAPLAPNYRNFLSTYGADGSGVIVQHVDGGVDFNHPDLQGRIEKCIDYGGSPDLCTARNHDDVIGHGTHTLGIVLGTGTTGLGDIDGFDYGLGVAPGAKAVVQNAIGVFGGGAFNNGYTPVYTEAQNLGAIVSQNSWGPAGTPQGYDEDTREFDAIARDADPSEPGDQPMALMFSIMNGGGGTSSQGSPDEGKNIFGIGGTWNRGGANPKTPDDLCFCTAHGPALDGRLLPTLVAPGQQVISTRAAQGTLCGIPFLGYSPTEPSLEVPPSPLHAGCTGTSMASPHASGAYAVFVDWYRDHFGGTTPSPALVKAAFVNGADDLAGAKDADGRTMSHIPNNQQGWGRLNLGNVLAAWTAGAVQIDQSVVFTASGQTHGMSVAPIDPAKPLKVSLAWTDALGHGKGGRLPAWVNDLDLTVTAADGTTWLGNVFAQGVSTTGGSADRKNNIENVFLPSAGAGPYQVTVSAANIIGDGMPNREGITDQDFALVITNARAAA